MKKSIRLLGGTIAAAVAVTLSACDVEVDYTVKSDNMIESSNTVSVDANNKEAVQTLQGLAAGSDCSSATVDGRFIVKCTNPPLNGITEGGSRDQESGFRLTPTKDGSFVFETWDNVGSEADNSGETIVVGDTKTTINITMPSAITDVATEGGIVDTVTNGNRTSVQLDISKPFAIKVTSSPLDGGVAQEVPSKVSGMKVKKGKRSGKKTVVTAKWKASATGEPEQYRVTYFKRVKGDWKTIKTLKTSRTVSKAKMKNKKRYKVVVAGVNAVGEGPAKAKKFRLR